MEGQDDIEGLPAGSIDVYVEILFGLLVTINEGLHTSTCFPVMKGG